MRRASSTAPDATPASASACYAPEPCPLCVTVTASVARGITAFFKEFVNDPEQRLRLRAARGFCAQHSQMVVAKGDALGAAIVYHDLAESAIESWSHKSGLRVRIGANRTASCPACQLQAEAEGRYTGALASGLAEVEVWEQLKAANAFCVRHVEMTAAAAQADQANRFLALQARKLGDLRDQLAEVIRKNDYRFRGEEWGNERDSWLRAVSQLRRP
jgi:hypothetical protein